VRASPAAGRRPAPPLQKAAQPCQPKTRFCVGTLDNVFFCADVFNISVKYESDPKSRWPNRPPQHHLLRLSPTPPGAPFCAASLRVRPRFRSWLSRLDMSLPGGVPASQGAGAGPGWSCAAGMAQWRPLPAQGQAAQGSRQLARTTTGVFWEESFDPPSKII